MTSSTQCLATFVVCLSAGLGAGCDRLVTPVIPKPEPATLPAETWCNAACARWQAVGRKEGNDVCRHFGADGECDQWQSCLQACESEPHAYPTRMCVADPPVGAGCSE